MIIVLAFVALAAADKVAPPTSAADASTELHAPQTYSAPIAPAAPAPVYSEPQPVAGPVDSENYYYYYYPVEEEKQDIFAIKKEFLDNLDLKKVSIVVLVVIGILLIAPEIAALLGVADLINTIAGGVTGVTGRELDAVNIRYDDVSFVAHMVLDAINKVY